MSLVPFSMGKNNFEEVYAEMFTVHMIRVRCGIYVKFPQTADCEISWLHLAL